jgi:hypothetical protein
MLAVLLLDEPGGSSLSVVCSATRRGKSRRETSSLPRVLSNASPQPGASARAWAKPIRITSATSA